MKASEIQALLDEPACDHNKKSKSGCAQPKPGATQGGCCYDGAQRAAADRRRRAYRAWPDRLRRLVLGQSRLALQRLRRSTASA